MNTDKNRDSSVGGTNHDDVQRQSIAAATRAKAALRQNAYADFEVQAPHVRQLLGTLPVLSPNASVLQSVRFEKAEPQNTDAVMAYLAEKWIAQHPPGSHEGAIHVEVDYDRLLIFSFHFYLWGKTTEALRIVIARVAQDAFLYWSSNSPSPLK